jgi:hypothetical protein
MHIYCYCTLSSTCCRLAPYRWDIPHAEHCGCELSSKQSAITHLAILQQQSTILSQNQSKADPLTCRFFRCHPCSTSILHSYFMLLCWLTMTMIDSVVISSTFTQNRNSAADCCCCCRVQEFDFDFPSQWSQPHSILCLEGQCQDQFESHVDLTPFQVSTLPIQPYFHTPAEWAR